jgi:AraC-like DNA-binding protein
MIQYIDWLPQLESVKDVVGIENQVAIFTYSDILKNLTTQDDFATLNEILGNPHKFDFFMIVHHTHGRLDAKIDMQDIHITKPNNSIKLAPGQIVEIVSISEDFDATVMILSKRFIEDMMVHLNVQIPFRSRKDINPIEHLTDGDMAMEQHFLKAVKHILSNQDNPYRLQVLQHTILAIIYSSEKIRDIKEVEQPRTNADIIAKEFIKLVQENFRQERQLQFYADKLCITPRYLSRVVKESTSSSAADWIERYVVLEARALLKSTNMTIQQISDYLNFPSQTFFGKYFKRRMGVSPKEYRRVG